MIHVAVADRYHQTRTFSFTQDSVVIGSDDDADLRIDSEGVAGRHLRVVREGDDLYVDDLRHGGAQSLAPVQPQDVVEVGGVELHVSLVQLTLDGVEDEAERRLLDEIRERPADPDLRIVYADWLDERGQPARAEFLRTQLATQRATTASDPVFVEASRRLAELAPLVGDGWRARVAQVFIQCAPKSEHDIAMMRARYQAPPVEEVAFELVCPMRWENLAPTPHESVRMCGACNREVTYCTSIDQARTLVSEGACITIDLGAQRRKGDMHGPMVTGRPSPPMSHYGKRLRPAPLSDE